MAVLIFQIPVGAGGKPMDGGKAKGKGMGSTDSTPTLTSSKSAAVPEPRQPPRITPKEMPRDRHDKPPERESMVKKMDRKKEKEEKMEKYEKRKDKEEKAWNSEKGKERDEKIEKVEKSEKRKDKEEKMEKSEKDKKSEKEKKYDEEPKIPLEPRSENPAAASSAGPPQGPATATPVPFVPMPFIQTGKGQPFLSYLARFQLKVKTCHVMALFFVWPKNCREVGATVDVASGTRRCRSSWTDGFWQRSWWSSGIWQRQRICNRAGAPDWA